MHCDVGILLITHEGQVSVTGTMPDMPANTKEIPLKLKTLVVLLRKSSENKINYGLFRKSTSGHVFMIG